MSWSETRWGRSDTIEVTNVGEYGRIVRVPCPPAEAPSRQHLDFLAIHTLQGAPMTLARCIVEAYLATYGVTPVIDRRS